MSTARLMTGWEALESTRTAPDLDVRELEKRTRLMRIITRRIALSERPNRDIAHRMGISPQKLSDLLSGRVEQFTIDELKTLRETIDVD
ncbi:XRE family transcriptional regulator [Aidingimonas halophila]|uniref:Transcriptional regulator, XRE family n=1 Tax=Aidingimonas halophila TaxID=574349 RepID=A0A1H2STA5_9GAMM|nr:XRE family transcriptional regulator [Aidingimonas halophila]GHC17169.1 hypothetical protein GCM10008094_03240 [Aidingimonas halophila]SDW34901.1 transcriptional regulator, XRE family [Aidingimonas halophila]